MGGFYGNITNTSKTQFQFDKIYPNRYEMERQKSTDGIYAGRYVLVEYDSAYQQDDFYRVWIINNVMYNANSATNSNKILRGTSEISNDGKKLNSVPAGTIVFTADVKLSSDAGHQYTNMRYYQITDESAIGSAVSYKEIVNGLNIPNYTINYNIDVSTYGAGRGYDSTVWQKAYVDGYEKYIMIAELNSVVPTFDVSADAPTMDPLVPHFDTQSTDIYYKLHWQPSWGFRVAEGENGNQITTSTDKNVGKYPTDIEVNYDKNTFNAQNGKNETTKISYPGAIYFNQAGFEEDVHNEYTGSFNNEISITPSGVSGAYYNKHDSTSDTSIQPDIQELRIILPALGNILCSVWDKVYGYDKTNGNKRYKDIEWKDAANINKKFNGEIVPEKGQQGKAELGYMTRDPQTIAGCINIVHDLLGMILTTDDITLNEVSYNTNRIYYKNGKYYRIHRFPRYAKITDISAATELDPADFGSDQEYTQAFENAVNKILEGHEDEDWYLVLNESTPNWQVRRFSKKALTKKALQNYSLAYIIRDAAGDISYDYEKREITGFAKDLSTVNGLILQLKQLIESDDYETRDRETVQGTINSLNDIINIFEDLIPGEFLICDSNGHVNSANWTTKQSFNYTNEGGIPSNTKDFSNKENQWIELSLDEDDRLISLQHKAHNVDSTRTVSDKNDLSIGNGLNKDTTKDKISLYTPIVDNTGHIIGKNTETVTLPYGYRYLETNGSSTEVEDLYTTITSSDDGNNIDVKITPSLKTAQAESTQDKISINSGNKWIQSKIENTNGNDIVTIAHEIHSVNTATKSTNLNTDNVASNKDNDKITLQDLEFDEAGHIIKNSRHTYTLPYGFKTIMVNNTVDTAVDAPALIVNNNGQSAENTQDILTISASNRWIKLDNNTEDTIKIGHKLSSLSDSAKANTYYGLIVDETVATLDKDNQFEVPCFKFDEAGHIIGARTHTVNLPENFDKIAVTVSDTNNVNSENGTATTDKTLVEADSLSDTLTFAEGNRWINITPDANNNRLTFSHYAKQFTETTGTIDCNVNTNNKINVQELTWDKAGHLTASQKQTYTLPNSIKTLSISNSGNKVVKLDTVPNNGTLIATNVVDTINIDTGNKWIQLVADSTGKKVTLYHSPAGGTTISTTQTGDETPAFGATFKIPEVKYDEAGHVTSTSIHTVKVPQPSLNDFVATKSSVLTGISMNDSTGTITQTNANIGTLTLAGYTKGLNASEIVADDEINGAFSKLQVHIDNIDTSLTNVDNRVTREVANRETAINNETTARNTAIRTAIEALDVNGVSNIGAGETIKSWSETDGKISVTTQSINITNSNIAPNAAIDMSKIDGLTDALAEKQPVGNYEKAGAAAAIKAEILGGADANNTIQVLLDKIAELEERITALEGNTKEKPGV